PYLGLNFVLMPTGLWQIAQQPSHLTDWQHVLTTTHGSPALMVAGALLAFPKLALGLSGLETGGVVMPLVRGERGDDPQRPAARIKNTRKLLFSAALIMCFYLAASSL